MLYIYKTIIFWVLAVNISYCVWFKPCVCMYTPGWLPDTVQYSGPYIPCCVLCLLVYSRATRWHRAVFRPVYSVLCSMFACILQGDSLTPCSIPARIFRVVFYVCLYTPGRLADTMQYSGPYIPCCVLLHIISSPHDCLQHRCQGNTIFLLTEL